MTKKSDAPAIRFKGFSDAWEQRKLGDIVGIYDGVHQTPNYQNSGVMFLSVENIATLKSSKFISEEDFKRDYKVFPQENDILMTRIGDVGTTNVVTDNGLKAYYVSLALLKYKSTDPYFLSNAIQSDYIQKGLANRTLKTAIPMKINKDEIGKVSVMLPLSATEQQQIGTCFRNLDNLITLHQRKFEKLTNVKKSMLEKMFPQNGSSYPEIRFKGFTDPWEQRKLGDVVKEITRNDPESEAPIMMITANNGFIEQSERYAFNNAGESLKKYILLKKGELAYNHGASKLRPYGSCFALTTAENARVPFVYHCFSAENQNAEFMSIELNGAEIENQLRKIVSSGARMDGLLNISFDEYTSVSVILPGTEEQDRIADFFRHLDNLITLHQRQHFLHSTPDISLSVRLIHPFYTSSWEQRKLGDIGKARSGVGFPDADQGGVTGVPFFKVSDMNLDGNENEMIVANNYVTAEQIADHRWSPITELPAIFFAKVGAAVMLNRKRLCRFPFLLDNNTMAYSLSPTKWDADFAKALFGTVDLTSLVQVGALPSYNAGDVESMGIYLPSLFEQEQIGAFFKLLDNLITLHQRKGKAAVSGCSNDANNSKGVCCKARDFGYKCHKKDEPNRFDA